MVLRGLRARREAWVLGAVRWLSFVCKYAFEVTSRVHDTNDRDLVLLVDGEEHEVAIEGSRERTDT